MLRLDRLLIVLLVSLLTACGGGGGAGTPTSSPVTTPPVITPPVVTPPADSRLTKVTLQSDAGDAIGLGQSYAYSLSDAKISVTSQGNQLVVQVEGDETWTGVFQTGGAEHTKLQVGTVADVPRYVDGLDAGKSGLTWFGEARSCTSSYGWFAIDSLKYSGTFLTEVRVRFERHCNGVAAALRGEITFYADDQTKPPLPVSPPPASLWAPPADVANSIGNYAYFESDVGDYVGAGKTYRYDQRSASVLVSGGGTRWSIQVRGDETWSAELSAPASPPALVAGYYPGVHGSRFSNPVKGGLSWTGVGRGCSKSSGWFVIDSVATGSNGLVTALDLRFVQQCEGRAAALRGVVHWRDPALATLQPAAGNTAAGSWRAPAASLPGSGNYLYMQSDPGEPLARGLIDLQTSRNAQLTVTPQGNLMEIHGQGTHDWRVNLVARPGQTQFAAGSYANMSGYPVAGPDGALSVFGDSYASGNPKGWLVIDNIVYAGSSVVALDLRFEQLGSNGQKNDSGLLHGQLHWRADQSDNFAGPSLQSPALFWRPPPGSTPSAGNYVYLESDRSDFLGIAPALLYTPLNSLLNVTATGNSVVFSIAGDDRWQGRFQAMSTLNRIQAGYYAGVDNAAYSNPVRGGFSWSGAGKGCNTATSGVIVDKASYVGEQLVELRLRFEQHCENEPGAMRGEIRWLAGDIQQPAGPAYPAPAALWRAPAGTLPSSGNYLYVQSDAGEAIGGGKTWLMTDKDTSFYGFSSSPVNSEAYFRLAANSLAKGAGSWTGEFQAMVGVRQFQVGLYDGVLRYPFQNRAFGGLEWTANGSGCNLLNGWFAIDKATYVNGVLTAVHARFEQHCEYLAPALHGELNWEAPPAATTLSARR